LRRDAGHDRWADAVHDELGVPLDQRHQRGEPADDLLLRWRLDQVQHGLHRGRILHGVGQRVHPAAEPLGERLGVELRGVHEPLHLVDEVAAQPRHGRELGAVGHLV
jgi:hypothetical protein